MKTKYFLLILLILNFASCELLEESPQSFVSPDQYFNTEAEVEAAIFGVYAFMHGLDIADANWMWLGDLGTDVAITRAQDHTRYHYSLLEIENVSSNNRWREYYSAIGAANSVIKRVNDNENLNPDFKRRIIGEAKFLRGFFYHHLNLIWGNVPLWLDELDLDVVEDTGTSPSSEVVGQIISDLTDAVNDLPPAASQNGRVSSWMAKGLLARVYLFNKQWEDAKALAEDVIENSGYSLLPEYYDVFYWQNKFNDELMHVVPKLANVKGAYIHSYSSPRPFDDNALFEIPEGHSVIRPDGKLSTDKSSRNPGSLFQGWGLYQTSKEHYDSYAPGDTRKDIWWHELKFTDGSTYTFNGGGSADLPGRSGYYPLKWIAWDEAPNDGGRDIHLQRLAELYLIFAEAENELNGPTEDAYQAINTIRRRAFGNSDNDLSGLNKDEFRRAIIDENRFELALEGLRRWYLWHWGYETYLEAAQFVAGSNPQLLENLKPHHRYFKIPTEEILKNPNLQQNPGY